MGYHLFPRVGGPGMYDSIVVAIPRHIVYDCLVGVSWAVELGLHSYCTSQTYRGRPYRQADQQTDM